MDDAKVLPDAVTTLINLLRDTFGDTFKAYYEGDPIEIPKANFPCIIVENVNTAVDLDATSSDSFQEQISVRLVYNKLDDLGVSDDYDMTERKLRRRIQARDATTGQYLPGTVLYALRTNITLQGLALESNVDITYGLQPRPDSVVTSEANVSLIIRERVMITNRF